MNKWKVTYNSTSHFHKKRKKKRKKKKRMNEYKFKTKEINPIKCLYFEFPVGNKLNR